jgi:catechol 2,3-dioxygenase-like lactoylglutathione lyase family enzyme
MVLVPELVTPDPEAAGRLLARFGFAPDAGIWRLGSQALRLVAGPARGHGVIDHVALAVPDLDATLAGLTAQGLVLGSVTPSGPETIPEFWEGGLRYAYLDGPDGARLELCQRLTDPAPVIGQDHVGIPCRDLAGMEPFFRAQGARPVAAVDLVRPEGVIEVRFLAFHGGMVELYQPPVPAPAAPGHWSRLLVAGLSAPVTGPEGLTLAPL